LKFAERIKKSIVLLFIDLDHMKWINDTLGHQEGDTSLVEIAAILRQTFRQSDIIGRMGGDEFAVLAIDTAHEGRNTAARLRAALDSYNKSETRRYKLSLSVGAAHFDPENPSPLDELIAAADNLMYEEKRTKRH
jgi:diguanylate cyclase (GGDEF)-like protein